jgi:hypothetical protein
MPIAEHGCTRALRTRRCAMSMKALLCGAATVLLAVGSVSPLDLATTLEPEPADPSRTLDLGPSGGKGRRAGHDPTGSPRISLAAAQPGGSGHQGGGGSGQPRGGAPRPPGGAPGHPPGGSPGHPPGRSPGHPPGWHGRPPVHHPGYHPGVRGGFYAGAWPWWYWWPYPGPVYTAPPPPPEESYWYYCPTYGAYYPDVLICPDPWVPVPAG